MTNDDTLLKEPKIADWVTRIESQGCTIQKISPLNIIRKKNGELLFALLDTVVLSPDGHKLPNIVFIRGHACVIVTLLKNRDTGDERYLMVLQRRIGSGQLSTEFPAGMLDNNCDNPKKVAVHELLEETGLAIEEKDLFSLTDSLLYSSVGAADEGIYYFGCIKEISDNEFQTFQNRSGGNIDENENITTSLYTKSQVLNNSTSTQIHLGLFLFDHYLKSKTTAI